MNLHHVNDKTMQIKRYPNEIIKFFQENYPGKPDLAHLLFDFQWQLFETYDNQLSITMVEVDSSVELLSLLYLQKECFTKTALHIRLLCDDLSIWQDTLLLENSDNSALQIVIENLKHISPVNILGWQRFKFDDGKVILDICPNADGVSDNYPIEDRTKAQAIQFGLGFDTEQTSHPIASFISKTSMSLASIFIADEQPLSKSFINERLFIDSLKSYGEATAQKHHLCPIPRTKSDIEAPVAIIGGGLASVHLALSLAERGKTVKIFCKDSEVAQGASGNKQGALYPLLTPENSELSQFFQQAFLFSRQRVQQLSADGYKLDHDFCGVLQSGHDERSTDRLNKILDGQDWPDDIVQSVDANRANDIAGINIDKPAAFYPLAGWVCPFEFTQATLAKAKSLSDVSIKYNYNITKLEKTGDAWLLHTDKEVFGPFKQVVNATGSQLINFEQTKELPASNFRGQVSHIPSRSKISKLKTVICAHGYMTPANNNMHCVGASYVRLSHDRSYQPIEQLDNLQKMQHSYPEKEWIDDIDISGHDARVGVRMVTRDHFPMLGCAPDYEKLVEMQKPILNKRKSYVEQYWRDTEAPIIEGLYVLGALGSRGLCSGPLAAEVMASLLCNEIPPVDYNLLKKLNPNRMWIRKIEKNKPI
ncbi:FAD-dependent 5-carboxymethylaminomethyl-2-thiouridine(34) oxidoreductase MnmC [Shewanella sp. 202IG2-18]|uniref:FAD-dependent 5-carboxymethylaminomethyl-2-thiouridine(34) oxidoreductase MnmC n=1 Tax=Parashewanella hymeniacidonis TaxID=2807618 RepID=UPI0019612CA8|nr:FAD-dependent 5-carboxymethylaminomethyl-2-thiouridine(34) oxidoreductase MnmC [Parashewanella hymeniacidonis]